MKTERIELRVTPDEKAGFDEAASIAGLAMSAWARERLRRAAIRELEEASRPIPFVRGRNRPDGDI
ncbi:hypothetical protein [Mesorhizobium sp. M0029]|uniref:plasmid mobilization protein n=1 Tax=Mesorhizobium sp. M0029 TaxID=2956850 RepID=UPI0033354EA4